MDLHWFQIGPAPANAIIGKYDYSLVALSYLIAVLASYVALDFVGRLQAEPRVHAKYYWLLGGAFAMGAGIWSMHFIGMLAFIMPMPMGYEFYWTALSLVVAVSVSAIALYVLKERKQTLTYLFTGGILIGLGIAAMHYTGMTGMTTQVNIRYIPSIFFLSILIAIVASEAAIWLAFKSNVGPVRRQFYLKVLSAFIMGIAICGMHYTGMAAAVFFPLADGMDMLSAIVNPNLLAFFVAITTILIICVALLASNYSRHLFYRVQNEKEFLNSMLNNINDQIIACDNEGKITACNNAFGNYCTLLNSGSYQGLDRFFQLETVDFIPLTPEQNPLLLALRGKRIVNESYLMRFTKEDIVVEVVIDGQPIINPDGEKLGAVIVIHDVTELKRTEKLKNEFVSIVSHELRTPLTSIKGALSLLLSEQLVNLPTDKNLLQIAFNNTERLIRLINDLLDIKKIEAGKMEYKFEDIEVSTLIKTALEDLEGVANREQIKLTFEEVIQAHVKGDQDRLMQVFFNIITNAIRFSSAGQEIKIKLVSFDHGVRISVQDQGIGIAPEFQERIFQKFSQADSSATRNKGGTGLGLFICKSIIEEHGGNISFESELNRGSTFFIDLPRISVKEHEMVH